MGFGNIGTIWASIGLDTKKLDQGIAKSKTKLAGADRSLQTMGQRMSANSTKFLMAGGIMVGAAAAAGGAAVKMASDFETSMRNVNSIMRVSEDEFDDISAAVLDISKELPQAATTLANGLYDIASSGFQGAEGLEVLEASARAAAAGLTETEVSAKGITAVLNAYGLEAEEADRISDTMFRTVDKGVITFEQLSGSLGDVLGTANLANVEFEELSGALGYVTTQGLSADVATTSLNRTILSIIDPSDELAEVLRRAGYESGEMALQQVGLVGVLELVDEAAGGSITKLKEMFVDMRSLRGAGALLGNGIEELSGYMADFEDTTGATNRALEEQSKSLSYQMDLLKSSISAVGITLGNEFIPEVNIAVKRLSVFVDENDEAIVSAAKWGIKSGMIVGGIALIAGALGKLRAAIIGHPIGAILTAITALNVATELGASELEEYGGKWGDVGAQAARAHAPVTGLIDNIKGQITIIEGIKEGIIEWDEVSQINSLTQREFRDRIEEVKEAEDAVAAGVYDSIEAYDSAITYVQNYSDELPNASGRMVELTTQLQNGQISTEAFTLGVEELRKETKGGREDIEAAAVATNDYADKQDLARIKVEAHSGAQEEAEYQIDETTESVDEQTKSIEELTNEFNELINSIFSGVTTWNDFEDAQIAQREAQEQVNELMAEGKEGTDEMTSAMNDLDAKNIAVVQSAFEVSQNIELTTEQQRLAKEAAIELGLQYVATEEIGVAAFLEMATEFGVSSADIITLAREMGIEIDDATRKRIIEVGADTDEATRVLEAFETSIDRITRARTVPISVSTRIGPGYAPAPTGGSGDDEGAMGGIITGTGIKSYASGGVIPQTGRAIPILAHEGEMILNTSQQNNLIDALWGVANGKSSGGNQPINVNVVAELDGRVIYEKTSRHIYNQSKVAQAGVGIR